MLSLDSWKKNPLITRIGIHSEFVISKLMKSELQQRLPTMSSIILKVTIHLFFLLVGMRGLQATQGDILLSYGLHR